MIDITTLSQEEQLQLLEKLWDCRRAFKFDQLCALNIDQGLLAACDRLNCG